MRKIYFLASLASAVMLLAKPPLRAAAQFELRTPKHAELIPVRLETDELEDCSQPEQRTTRYSLRTTSGVTFDVLHIDNNQKNVIVLGQGWYGTMYSMLPWIRAFGNSYDYVIFNYRWNHKCSMLTRLQTWLRPTHEMFNSPSEEVACVVDFIRAQKTYDEVVGLGVCYSSFTFLKAQAAAAKADVPLFTKLILDSCFVSLHSFLEGTINNSYISNLLYWGTPGMTALNHLRTIPKTPLLFIHGKNDRVVLQSHFEQLWDAAKTNKKAALFTPFAHADNIKGKATYTSVIKNFINHTFREFLENMEHE
jgi:hypothetical protein